MNWVNLFMGKVRKFFKSYTLSYHNIKATFITGLMLDGYWEQTLLHTVTTVMVLVNDVLNSLLKIGPMRYSALRYVFHNFLSLN